jgi:hypothetical protein
MGCFLRADQEIPPISEKGQEQNCKNQKNPRKTKNSVLRLFFKNRIRTTMLSNKPKNEGINLQGFFYLFTLQVFRFKKTHAMHFLG